MATSVGFTSGTNLFAKIVEKKERAPLKFGALLYFAVSRYKQFDRILHARDSHRESGVFSVVSLLSPVESIKPPIRAHGAHTLFVRLGDAGRKSFFRVNKLYVMWKCERGNSRVPWQPTRASQRGGLQDVT